MTVRRRISDTKRAAIFLAAGGLCHICGGKIHNKLWDVEHRIPLAMGGKDDESNWLPAHRDCHKDKTAGDLGSLAKCKRLANRHQFGIKKPSTFRKPPPGYEWDFKRGGVRKENQ